MIGEQLLAESKRPSNAATKKNQVGGAREEKCETCGACQDANAIHKASTCVFGTTATAKHGLANAEPSVAASKAAQAWVVWSPQFEETTRPESRFTD